MNQMVAGVPATMVAAELGGGARWPQLREGKREREEARPGQELTPERMPWTVMAGEAGVDGAVMLDARWLAREDEDGGGEPVRPAPIPSSWRRSTARR